MGKRRLQLVRTPSFLEVNPRKWFSDTSGWAYEGRDGRINYDGKDSTRGFSETVLMIAIERARTQGKEKP